MQNRPPTAPQYWSISALPPKSLTTAHPSGGVSLSPNPTERIRSGENPSHDGSSYELQIVSPGRQNADAGLEYGEVWPISQTNAFGVSCTMPQFSELPSSFVSNTGTIGPDGAVQDDGAALVRRLVGDVDVPAVTGCAEVEVQVDRVAGVHHHRRVLRAGRRASR